MVNKVRGSVIDLPLITASKPTSTSYPAGTVAFNSAGTSPVGWRYTVSGTSGTWEAFGSSVLTASFAFDPPAITAVSTGGGGGTPTEDYFVEIHDYGAVGDGVADDKPAFDAAVAAGSAVLLTPGTYKIGSAFDSQQLPIISLGATVVETDDANTYLRNFTELGKPAIGRTVYRGASEYSGTPTSYTNLYDKSCFHVGHYNNLGYQQLFNSDSGGRTMAPGFSLDGAHAGYGDVCAFFGNYGISKHASSASVTNWTGANSATVVGGQIGGLTDRVNLYGSEFHLVDNNNASISALGAVYNFIRDSSTYAYNTLWTGIRVQSSGTKAIDVGYQLYGKAQIGLDFSGADFKLLSGADSKIAIALKANDRIYFNVAASAPPNWHGLSAGLPPETYVTFDGTKYNFVTGGVSHLQTNSTVTLVQGGFNVTKSGTIIADFANVVSNKLFLGGPGYQIELNQKLNLTTQTTANSASAGVATALPAAPFTYLVIQLNGTDYKIPVYSN